MFGWRLSIGCALGAMLFAIALGINAYLERRYIFVWFNTFLVVVNAFTIYVNLRYLRVPRQDL